MPFINVKLIEGVFDATHKRSRYRFWRTARPWSASRAENYAVR